ncbi:PD40 domain-containing protein, partial [candidate division KSB1 bacterium]|nr:PD40 domain-containing protein [candidate division KSB1 bacterium]
MLSRKFFPLALIFLLLSQLAFAQTSATTKPDTSKPAEKKSEKKKDWDVTAAHGPTKEIAFTTDEGTWMNLDVSPDGKEIVFDLLGDIYSMPITGGAAKLLSGGPAFDLQPRYSPDGKHISFTSDRAGGDNIWLMQRDGTNAKQITKEDFRLLNNVVWTPDGNYLIARKHFTSTRSLGAGEMWLYHISGGEGLQLTKRKNDQQDAGEPCVSPDGRYVYFSEDMSGGSTFQYNKDPNGQIYVIRRFDRETGKLENFIAGPGGAVRPQVSRDGKYLAFVRRVRLKSVLYVHEFATGEEWPLYDKLSKDQQETWALFGVYPNYAWTPDNKRIMIWAQGKIWSVDVASKQATPISFTVNAKHTLTAALHAPQQAFADSFTVRMIREAVTSPDGKWLVFHGAGSLWKKQLPNGKPQRLTNDSHFEFFPTFSNDGLWIAYATWSDTALGALYKIRADARGKPLKLTKRKGYYITPSFSFDGKKLVYQRQDGNSMLGFAHGVEPGLYWMSAEGGEEHFIQED